MTLVIKSMYITAMYSTNFNLSATELNPISHLLALLGARPKVHISRIKVNTEQGNNHTRVTQLKIF
jgi:hypothetical protein